jgi:hypothetical protein
MRDNRMTDEAFVECPELSGKTIQTVRIYNDTGDGSEIQVELTDGTSFSYSISHHPVAKAILYKGGAGTPQVLRDYSL